jgi:hypothetical protein
MKLDLFAAVTIIGAYCPLSHKIIDQQKIEFAIPNFFAAGIVLLFKLLLS